jgi:phosphonate transport system permease protein
MNARHWTAVGLIVAAIVSSFVYLAIDPRQIFSREAAAQMWRYFAQFFPPDISPDYLARTWRGTLETVAISAVATVLAAIAGFLLALPASGRFGPAARAAARGAPRCAASRVAQEAARAPSLSCGMP